MLVYDDLKRLNTNEKKISCSYLSRQATIICHIKNHIKLLQFLENIRVDMGFTNNSQRKKIDEYTKLVNRLEDNFFDIVREIAFTIIFEEEYYSEKYLKSGLTWDQLQQIKTWTQLEGQKARYKDKPQKQAEYTKKLSKSMKSVYRSFL